MARPYRLESENCFYHVISRGDDRKRIFVRGRDYEKFFDYIAAAKDKFRFFLYAYCLMPNHYHLLLETTLPNISRTMQYINGSYTTYYNTKYQRCGHLFQGRFKSIVVERASYFLELSRYIHLNPVRAKLVDAPDEYVWSSYRGYIGSTDKNIDAEQIEKHLGMVCRQYHRFVMAGIGKEVDPLAKVYAGFLLGSTRFIKDKLRHLREQIASEEVSHKDALMDNEVIQGVIIDAVTRSYKISLADLRGRRTRPMRAKQVAIYLLRKYSALTNREIGEEFCMQYSAVSKAGLNIEQRMKDDRKLRHEVDEIISNFEV